MWAAATSQNRSWSLIDRLAFPAPQASYDINSFPGELILVPQVRADLLHSSIGHKDANAKVPCIFLPSQYARFLFICFHGNAEDLGKTYQFLCAMRDIFKVHILAVEYPGYGICPGDCSEAGVMANAWAAMHFATETLNWPCDGIKLFGRSLGTAPAMALAAQCDVAGLILVTPLLSLREVLRNQVGPLADFIQDAFQNYRLADKIESATLIVHGKQDDLVPYSHGHRLYELLPGRKMMVCPDSMHHNAPLLDNLRMFVMPMTQFFSLPDYTFTDITLPDWVMPPHLQRAPLTARPASDHRVARHGGLPAPMTARESRQDSMEPRRFSWPLGLYPSSAPSGGPSSSRPPSKPSTPRKICSRDSPPSSPSGPYIRTPSHVRPAPVSDDKDPVPTLV